MKDDFYVVQFDLLQLITSPYCLWLFTCYHVQVITLSAIMRL